MFAGRRQRSGGGVEVTAAVARTCWSQRRRRRWTVTVERSQLADDEHVEEENDQWNDEEDGQLGHPRPDGPEHRAALAAGQGRLHPQNALTRRRVVRPEIRLSAYQALTTMWANAQRDGRPAEYRWRLLFNAAKFG